MMAMARQLDSLTAQQLDGLTVDGGDYGDSTVGSGGVNM